MNPKINEIRRRLTKDFLIKTSQALIHLYKSRNFRQLKNTFNQLFPNNHEDDSKKTFYRLIKIYHPDSLEAHFQALDKILVTGHTDELVFFETMLAISLKPDRVSSIDYHHEESYEFDQGHYDIFSEDELGEADFEDDLISIITSIFLGNQNKRLDPIDLAQIDGELILSEQRINNLGGLQHCTNVRHLDLSYNQIDNVYEIKDLHLLEDLDLSHNQIDDIDPLSGLESLENLYLDENQIDDISPLLKLPKLKVLSIVGNPLTSMADIKALQEQGVVVLYF